MPAKNKETKEEHWIRKSIIVSIISMLIVSFGLLSLAIYDTGHLVAFAAGTTFWVALVTLAVVAVLVDFVKSNLTKVFWVEDIVGGLFGAIAYYIVFAAYGSVLWVTISGFLFGAVVLFIMFYFGFESGHWFDTNVLRKNGININ